MHTFLDSMFVFPTYLTLARIIGGEMSVFWFEASSHHKKLYQKINKVWSWREKTEKNEGSLYAG